MTEIVSPTRGLVLVSVTIFGYSNLYLDLFEATDHLCPYSDRKILIKNLYFQNLAIRVFMS